MNLWDELTPSPQIVFGIEHDFQQPGSAFLPVRLFEYLFGPSDVDNWKRGWSVFINDRLLQRIRAIVVAVIRQQKHLIGLREP
jgi:hypothetical protein